MLNLRRECLSVWFHVFLLYASPSDIAIKVMMCPTFLVISLYRCSFNPYYVRDKLFCEIFAIEAFNYCRIIFLRLLLDSLGKTCFSLIINKLRLFIVITIEINLTKK